MENNSAYVLAYKLEVPVILPEWEKTKKLCVEGVKLWEEGDKLCEEGVKLCEEGDKLCEEGVKLCEEGKKIYLDAVNREFGSLKVTINWDTGEIYAA